VHEYAHAFMADRKGDPTARLQGRLSLNPMVHLDPVGTLFLLIAGFGWGRPVPVDDYNLADPKRDMAIIALAGPAINLITAGLASGLLFLSVGGMVGVFLVRFILISVMLAFFNLIPLYPLDGSKILMAILPPDTAETVGYFLQEYSLILLVLLILPLFGGVSLISVFLSPLISLVVGVLIP